MNCCVSAHLFCCVGVFVVGGAVFIGCGCNRFAACRGRFASLCRGRLWRFSPATAAPNFLYSDSFKAAATAAPSFVYGATLP